MATEEEKKKLLLYDSSYLDRLQKSQAALDSHLSARPGDYQSKYQEQINKAMESIANRKPFQYDVNGDALYQQYKDRYTQMGKQAMQNTMGQAAALTGGYGNTYAQQVGQQVYGQYMQGLTDKIPELYQLALSKYDRDAAAEKDRYNLYKDADATDYGRWGDKLNQWNTDRSYLSGRADTELSQALTIGNTLYQRLAELGALGYTPSDEELRAAGLTRGQWDTLHPAVSYDGGGGDSGWSGGGGGRGVGKKSAEQIYKEAVKNGATSVELINLGKALRSEGSATSSQTNKWFTEARRQNARAASSAPKQTSTTVKKQKGYTK